MHDFFNEPSVYSTSNSFAAQRIQNIKMMLVCSWAKVRLRYGNLIRTLLCRLGLYYYFRVSQASPCSPVSDTPSLGRDSFFLRIPNVSPLCSFRTQDCCNLPTKDVWGAGWKERPYKIWLFFWRASPVGKSCVFAHSCGLWFLLQMTAISVCPLF